MRTRAIAGSALSGNSSAAKAGQGVMMGSQSLAQRNFLAYARDMESSADQAALRYLAATGQSPKGMIDLFEKLGRQSIATTADANPYVYSHPMPFERIRNLEQAAKKSKYFNVPDNPALMLRHQLVQAKLIGFIEGPQAVMKAYPSADQSLPARYARAIALFRRGDIGNALPVIDSLTRDLPQNPYFWELKGQALLENGRAQEAVAPLKEAVKLLPNNGLIQMLMAQALIDTGTTANATAALKLLRQAQKSEGDAPILYKYMAQAYGITGDIPRATLATADYAYMRGDKDLALEKSKAAQKMFKAGSGPDELWDVTFKMEMPGMPMAMPAQTQQVCLKLLPNFRKPRYQVVGIRFLVLAGSEAKFSNDKIELCLKKRAQYGKRSEINLDGKPSSRRPAVGLVNQAYLGHILRAGFRMLTEKHEHIWRFTTFAKSGELLREFASRWIQGR